MKIASRKTLLIIIAINALLYLYVGWATPSARDFRAFYFGGETIRHAPEHLYDLDYQLRTQQTEFNDELKFLPFIHPPHELLLFAPLSLLPYTASLNIWRLFSVLCLLLSGILLAKSIGANITYTTLLASATYGAPMCLLLGQDSMLLLLLVCSSFYLLRKDLDLLAAFALAIALFKPQLPVILALAVMASGRAKFFASFVAFGSALSVASMAFVGRNGIIQLIHAQRIAEGIGVSQMPTLRGLIAFAAGDHRWMSVAILAATMLAMWPQWKKSQSLEFAFASAICVVSALPLYIYSYDLVVLAIPLAVMAKNWKRSDIPVIAALTSGPLSQIVYFLHAAWLLLFPTLALGWIIYSARSVHDGGSNASKGGGGQPADFMN